MNKETVKAALVFMLVGLVLGGIIGYGLFGRVAATTHITERDTITYVDTIAYYQPVAKDSTVVRYITQVLPVVYRDTITTYRKDTFLVENYAQNNGENIRIMRNSGCARQNSNEFGSALAGMEFPPLYASVDSDSAAVAIPITQKRYENEDYRAYVSGYEPNLDSIFVFPKTTVIHERSYKPPNKWHIGITGGYGYGFKSKQAEPYIGIGIKYSIISF